MPEDDLAIFSKVLEFICFGRVPYKLNVDIIAEMAGTDKHSDTSMIELEIATTGMMRTYVMADRLCIETLMNAVHDNC